MLRGLGKKFCRGESELLIKLQCFKQDFLVFTIPKNKQASVVTMYTSAMASMATNAAAATAVETHIRNGG